MNCKIRWIEHNGRKGYFYSCHTDRPLELPFMDACAFAQEEQAIGNKWGRAVSYQVVDEAGEVVYETCRDSSRNLTGEYTENR